MNAADVFSLDQFLSLEESELVEYAEPFVNVPSSEIPQDVYGPLCSELASMNERHVVYALEIGMRLNPLDFVYCAVSYLSHTDAAVCCSACRAIEFLSPDSMPRDVVAKIAATPIEDLFANDLRTNERIRIGTNAVFIRDLVAKFTPK